MTAEPTLRDSSVPLRSRPRSPLRVALTAIAGAAAGVIAAVLAVGFILSAPAHETIGPAPPDLPVAAVNIASASGATLARLVSGRAARRRGGRAAARRAGQSASDASSRRTPARRRIRGLLFDFQAHGESTGVRITFGHLEGLDAHAAVALMRERLPRERIGAIGSSLGGAAALLGPAPLPVDALVLESVYPDIRACRLSRQRTGVLDRTAESVAVAWELPLLRRYQPLGDLSLCPTCG